MSEVVPIKRHVAYEKAQKRSVARTLACAKEFRCKTVLIIGVDEDGDLMVRAHPPSPGDALWLMERAKMHLLNGGE